MKKILCLVVALMMVTSLVYAQSGYPYRNVRLQSTVTQGHTHVNVGPCYVYSVMLTTTVANQWVALTNSAGTALSNSIATFVGTDRAEANIKADIGEATAGDSVIVELDNPIYFEQGLFVEVGDGINSGNNQAVDGINQALSPPAVTIVYATE